MEKLLDLEKLHKDHRWKKLRKLVTISILCVVLATGGSQALKHHGKTSSSVKNNVDTSTTEPLQTTLPSTKEGTNTQQTSSTKDLEQKIAQQQALAKQYEALAKLYANQAYQIGNQSYTMPTIDAGSANQSSNVSTNSNYPISTNNMVTPKNLPPECQDMLSVRDQLQKARFNLINVDYNYSDNGTAGNKWGYSGNGFANAAAQAHQIAQAEVDRLQNKYNDLVVLCK